MEIIIILSLVAFSLFAVFGFIDFIRKINGTNED